MATKIDIDELLKGYQLPTGDEERQMLTDAVNAIAREDGMTLGKLKNIARMMLAAINNKLSPLEMLVRVGKLGASSYISKNNKPIRNAKYANHMDLIKNKGEFKVSDWVPAVQKRDLTYNPKLMDPKYLSTVAARRGLNPYVYDFDDDGVDDYILANNDRDIIAYNGYQSRPTKQQQYAKYYKDTEADADEFGKRKVRFGEFNRNYANEKYTSQNPADVKAIKALNSENRLNNRATYKAIPTTINAMVKAKVKELYEDVITVKAGDSAVLLKKLRKYYPFTIVGSSIVRCIIYPIFNVGPELKSDSAEGKLITKILKRRKTTSDRAFRDAFIKYIGELFEDGEFTDGVKNNLNAMFQDKLDNMNEFNDLIVKGVIASINGRESELAITLAKNAQVLMELAAKDKAIPLGEDMLISE